MLMEARVYGDQDIDNLTESDSDSDDPVPFRSKRWHPVPEIEHMSRTERFIILFSIFMSCIPAFTIWLCSKAFWYFAGRINEPTKTGTTENWGWHLGVNANLVFALDATVFVGYISLFTPVMSLVILQRYFERNDDLRRLTSRLTSTCSTINILLLHVFGLVALLAYSVVAFGWAFFALEASVFTCILLLFASLAFVVGFIAVAWSLFKRIGVLYPLLLPCV